MSLTSYRAAPSRDTFGLRRGALFGACRMAYRMKKRVRPEFWFGACALDRNWFYDHRREILGFRNLLGLAMTYSPTS